MGLMNEFIEAQRQQQNDPQRSVHRSIDTTDNRADPRFVEVMDLDPEVNQDNFNQTVDNSLVSDQEEPVAEQPKKVKKGPKKSVKKTKAAKKRPELSSDSEQDLEKDPDFEPVF